VTDLIVSARGIKVVERAIMPPELQKADEVFLTGSAAEVTPVGALGAGSRLCLCRTGNFLRPYRELNQAIREVSALIR
jgi:branched-subunit amino acid aminotransferase/4-amino-4-deoxychorismate lyase